MSPIEIVAKLLALVLDLVGVAEAHELLSAEGVRRANLAADAIEAERFGTRGDL